jgi:hypothetical protein
MTTLCLYAVWNVGGVNAAVIFNIVIVANWGGGLGKAIRRNQFLLTLGQQATIPWTPKSSTIADLHAGTWSLIQKFAGGDARREAPQTSGSGRCSLCPRKMTEKQ